MKKLVVAIFEDDEINRFICQNLLKSKENIEVHVFENPELGFSMAKSSAFDVVFIETHYYGQNFHGLTILKKLQDISLKKDFVSVATTALLQDGDVERIISAGFTMCMEKPLSFESIERLQEI
jgi:CheY-like chemotaxis protein